MKPQLIGYACDTAANIPGAANGPVVLKNSDYLKPLLLNWLKLIRTDPADLSTDRTSTIHQLSQQWAAITATLTQQQQTFLTVGGDHSCAIGTWQGAASKLSGDLGLIWIDAHMDAHTPASSPTHNIHGMPVATLLGHGNKTLTHLCSKTPAVKPRNLALIGIRSYEPAELELLDALQVKIYFIDEVKERGIAAILQEAMQHVTQQSAGFGVSIDIDAINPKQAPGVSTPEENGINSHNFLSSLALIANHDCFIGAEIAEFNPDYDVDQKTEKLIAMIIQRLFNLA
jgi:arginase